MTEFTLVAPLANEEGFEPIGFYEQFVLALGRMTGAMLPDGAVLDVGNCTLSNITLQGFLTDAGLDVLVANSAPSNDDHSTFIAVHGGDIYRMTSWIADGALITKIHKAEMDECQKDCGVVKEFTDGVKSIVGDALRAAGLAEKDDQINGHIKINIHAAICERVVAKGNFLVFKGKSLEISGGFSFAVDCPKANAEVEEVLEYLSIGQMSPAEIGVEQELQKRLFGISNPFPVRVGEA